ncbi:MAG: tRNA(Ile)(2)-agmatinylcytidine synthase [Desulfurococcales archaeon]|nr:tRNA(Ile)(2)-agmatinylcytidine synthase [Desulfurococcales archaeon]
MASREYTDQCDGGTPFTLALDDSDSGLGGCTTHLAGLLLFKLSRRLCLADYPLLVRLAPGVPWKTRGNAAVVIRGYLLEGNLEDLLETAVNLARDYSLGRPAEPGKGPGAAIYPGIDAWRSERLRTLYNVGLRTLLHWEAVSRVAAREGVITSGGRGRIGAVASLAALAPGEPYTYELIAYRRPELWGTRRCVDDDPLFEAQLPPCTFNNFDLHRGALIAAPHGPDPVLAGFRGTCPEYLGCYKGVLCERPHFWVLYRSNQHTDSHHVLTPRLTLYSSGLVNAKIASAPKLLPGGHVIVESTIGDPPERVYLAAYRETGAVKAQLLDTIVGDTLEVGGTLRPRAEGSTLSIEKIYRTWRSSRTSKLAPRCPRCGHRMKSAGRGKGYKCPNCGYHDPDGKPVIVHIPPRPSAPAAPPAGRLGHLTRPTHIPKLPVSPPSPPRLEDVLSLEDPPELTLRGCRGA